MLQRHRLLFLTLFFLLTFVHANLTTGPNAYSILGVSKTANQEDIRKKYRDLCLKLHPDKNVDKSVKEKERREEQFKQVQRAYSLIGDASSRREYDSSLKASFKYGIPRDYYRYSSGSSADRLFREFYQRQNFYSQASSQRKRAPFYVNGIDISNLFSAADSNGIFAAFSHLQSVYEETVSIPLSELYDGKSLQKFVLRDTIFQRYKAAFKGGIAKPIAVQGLFSSLALLLRTNLPMSCVFFLGFFHFSLPRPEKRIYETPLKKGWKGGTKLKFQFPGFVVIFVIQEQKHDRFLRVGDDLMTEVTISETKAKKGCEVLIEPLGETELPILIQLKPGQIWQSEQIVRVTGRGWPKTRSGKKGDLLVKVNVISDKQNKKLEKNKRKTRKKS